MRIIIVDDHPLVRQGLYTILSKESDMEVIGEAANVREASKLIQNLCPDLALIDLRLGSECGFDIICEIRKQQSSTKFIVLTSSASPEYFMEADEYGVEGYVLKEALPEELLYAIRLVDHGRKYYDPGLLKYKMLQDEKKPGGELTEREKEVLMELGRGLNNRQIADKLYITENTVKKHVGQILTKLDLRDRTQAAIYVNKMELKYTL